MSAHPSNDIPWWGAWVWLGMIAGSATWVVLTIIGLVTVAGWVW